MSFTVFMMRLGFGLDSPKKDPMTQSPKRALSGTSPVGKSDGDFSYHMLPPVGPNEIEFYLDSPQSYKPRESVRSGRKRAGCFTFNILVYPAGNQTSTYGSSPKMAVYVEAADVEDKDSRWVYNGVKFAICVVNFKDYRKSLYHDDTHSFCAAAIDRGWPDLLSHSDMTGDSGWLDDKGRLCIRAGVLARQADTLQIGPEFDTRKETGFIGLKNHGATCYLNGLLQSYFHIGKFREIVYRMEASLASSPTRMSLPLALQSVFLKLESSETAVNTVDLTRSFGWDDSLDAFTQHDAQELSRILVDKLEEKLKGTPGDGAIQQLFEGKLENYIECLDVDFKSKKIESFYDIPLNVRGLAGQPLGSLQAALAEFTAVEILEGDNAYEAEGFGKQRAKKGIRFSKFPPVLSFQLKRFAFDFEKLDNVKVNDRFEFPESLDLDSSLYDLHTVLVHAGDVHSGHYYAFIRPNGGKHWFRFDDEQVTPCGSFAAMEDNFGGDDVLPYNYCAVGKRPVVRPRIHSAYMLVYIRRSEASVLLSRPSISDVELRVSEESKKIEEKRRELELERQVVTLNVKLDSQLHVFERVRRDSSLREVAKLIGRPDDLRWFFLQSGKYHLLTRLEDLPLEPSADLLAVSSDSTSSHLVIVKQFDVTTRVLSEGSARCVNPDEKISLLLPPGSVDEFLVFDESSLRMVEVGASFIAENIGSGSTLVIQTNTITEADTEESSEDELSTVPQLQAPKFTIRTFADHVRALAAEVEVGVVVIDANNHPVASEGILSSTGELISVPFENAAKLKMDKRWNLRVVVNELLNGFFSKETNERVEVYLHNPLVTREGPIATSDDLTRIGKVGKLGDYVTTAACQLFVVSVPESSILVRVFDDSVKEVSRKFVDVLSLGNSGKHVGVSELANSVSVPYRLVEFYSSQITRLYGPNESVDCQAALCNIRNPLFEYVRIEPGQADPPEGHIWLFVSHVDRNSGLHFGYPFVVSADPAITAKQARHVVQEKLRVDDKQAGRWRLCVEAGQRIIHLKEDDVVAAVSKAHGSITDKHVNLVLEHSHPNPELMGVHKPGSLQGSTAYKPLTIR